MGSLHIKSSVTTVDEELPFTTDVPKIPSQHNPIGHIFLSFLFHGLISRRKRAIPLGILEKDENKTEEMIEIIEHLQQYTPKAHDKMMPLLMGGDGLSVERGEGAQRARADGISQEDRLEGFIWKSEDWHAHVISLQYLIFWQNQNVSDIGSITTSGVSPP
ncbi:unnamed protein product [Mytilus edulis]|uniref:DUF6589 domain-containing protein n=1 Tax=Mytilus edulis TaxID=6550 RepID=A0A8S3SZ71_MYTED|nr:unnamed protein product [Mytilus edulis]